MNELPTGGIDCHADEILLGARAELLFSADVQLLIGYQRTPWGAGRLLLALRLARAHAATLEH